MNGYKALDIPYKDKKSKRIFIIIYTGKDMSLDEEKELRKYSYSIILNTAEYESRILKHLYSCIV